MNYYSVPRFRMEAFAVWRRNAMVWRRLIAASLLFHLGEPVLYLVGIGFGLGRFIGEMSDLPYFTFLASGFIAWSAMNVASMESMWSVYTRMVPQQTYEAILATPATVDDIVMGELLWCASKSLLSGSAILLVSAALGAVSHWSALLALPAIFLTGLCFAAPGLMITAYAKSYDYFSFYMTLALTPMFILCGVFYPVSSLPPLMQTIVQFLPLTHAVELIRPIVIGESVSNLYYHLSCLIIFGLLTTWAATVLIRRRLIK